MPAGYKATQGDEDDPIYRDELLSGLKDMAAPSAEAGADDYGPMPELPTDPGGTEPDMPVVIPPEGEVPPEDRGGPINDFPDPIPGYTPGGTQPPPETPVGPVVPGATPPSAGAAGLGDATRNRLMELIAMNPNAVSIDDPALAAASTAFRRAQDRSVARQREATAERMNARGLSGDSGALDLATERAFQASGNEQANYDATLVLNELTSRKSQLENMLKISAGILTADQDAQIRMAIANLNSEIERAKIGEAARSGDLNRSLEFDLAPLKYGGGV